MGANKKVLSFTVPSYAINSGYWDHVWMNSPAAYQGSHTYNTIAGSYLKSGEIRNDGSFATMGARPAFCL